MSDEGEYMTVNEKTGGKKGQKLARFDLIPPHPLFLLAEHYGVGAQKYPARNWELGVDWSNAFAAMQRHAWKFWQGEDLDFETQTYHLAAVAWHAFALLEYMDTHPELDDRPVVTPPEGQTTFDLTIPEVDPELERILAEEEAIERRLIDAAKEAEYDAHLLERFGERQRNPRSFPEYDEARPMGAETYGDAFQAALDAAEARMVKRLTDKVIYGDYDYVTPEFNTYESLGVTK